MHKRNPHHHTTPADVSDIQYNYWEEALDHVAAYTSKHSEAIVSENKETVNYYLKNTDAACVYANASTAFSDGAQFGLGAEIGSDINRTYTAL